MFALIETKGANHIAIHIPREGADKTIPALVGMLEQNAVFINKGWGTLETTTPVMSVVLGDKITLENNDTEMAVVIPAAVATLNESFVHATPEVRLSWTKAIEKKDAELQRLRTELAHTKQQLTDLQDQIDLATENGQF